MSVTSFHGQLAGIRDAYRHLLFSPTNGKLQVKASMKLGNQYGCEVELYCLIVMFLFAYLRIAPRLWYTSR